MIVRELDLFANESDIIINFKRRLKGNSFLQANLLRGTLYM
jgi:hypothetical protein